MKAVAKNVARGARCAGETLMERLRSFRKNGNKFVESKAGKMVRRWIFTT